MNDPTQSKYRYLAFRGSDTYRRFIQEDKAIKQSVPTLQDHETPAHGTYGALLFDSRWKSKREEIIKRDQYACVICKGKEGLQVHHRQYHFIVRENQFKLPWDYDDYLLISLCELCHKRGHNKFKVPTINI
jgi:hypothetical protein